MAAPADAGTGMPTLAVAGITEARAPTAGERARIVTAAVAASATAHATPDTPDVGSTPAKTFTLRSIKESLPYFHDSRLLIPWRTRSNSSTSSSNSSSTRTRSMRSWPSRRSCDGVCSGRVVWKCVC
jgi:hypothetical protein